MKTLSVLFLLLVVFSLGIVNIAAQDEGNCDDGTRNDVKNIYYTSCWADTGDDRARLQDAVDMAVAGRLIFDENNYEVSYAVEIPAYRILEGTSPDTALSPSKIMLTGSGQSIFHIGPGIREVTIRDLGFISDGKAAGTTGILAQDEKGNHNSSQKFHFNNLRFQGLTNGIWVKPDDPKVHWQFDNIHLDDSTFDHCDKAVYLDLNDSGWQMNSLLIDSGEDQSGIYIKQGGYISMNLIVGNAAPSNDIPPVPLADTFIYIQGHSVISVQNSAVEGYKKGFEIDGLYRNQPIYLINNGFPACPYDDGVDANAPSVIINNSVLISTGNDYACYSAPARPVIRGWSDVFSIGDKFCYDTSEFCTEQMSTPRSEFVVQGGVSTLNSSNVTEESDYARPMLDITAGYNGKTLLELGTSSYYGGVVNKYKYAFSRNSTDGWLDVEGSQSAPYTGYRFKNGPVQLTTSTQSNLSGYNSTATSGSMLYCSDCATGSAPCAGSGSGALALRVGSVWNCK